MDPEKPPARPKPSKRQAKANLPAKRGRGRPRKVNSKDSAQALESAIEPQKSAKRKRIGSLTPTEEEKLAHNQSTSENVVEPRPLLTVKPESVALNS
jgi:hypothetical protein